MVDLEKLENQNNKTAEKLLDNQASPIGTLATDNANVTDREVPATNLNPPPLISPKKNEHEE